MGICIALSYLLGTFDIFKLPYGGGVSLESLPLMLYSYLSGPVYGFISGFVYGVLMITKPSLFIHPVQFLLDYPLAFSSFFIIGFLGENKSKGMEERHPLQIIFSLKLSLFCFFSFVLRFCFHCVSGLLFLSLFIKEMPDNIFSYVFIYNLSYLLPTALFCTIVFGFIAPRFKNILKGP